MYAFQSLLNKKSNMIILKIGMVTGYWPDPDSLSQGFHVKHCL